MDQAKVDYFLKSPSKVGQLDTIELSHPSFSKTYFMVRNHLKGFTARLENGVNTFFEYVPMQIGKGSVKDDLDQTIDITIGDVGDIITLEIEKIELSQSYDIKPTLIYRTYRSDDFTRPLFGPVQLQVTDLQLTEEGCSFQAKAESLNVVKTGELYDLDRFKPLRGVI